jgi:adenylosuccinate lyase
VAEAVAAGRPNDLLERLSGDPAFSGVPGTQLRAELDPARYTGRAEAQVRDFLDETIEPLLDQLRPLAAAPDSAEVRV